MRTSERGVVLAMVLVVGFLVSIAMTSALTLTGHRLDRIASQQRHNTNFYAAEAGVQAAFYKIQRNIPPFQTPPGWPTSGPNAVRQEVMTIGSGSRARQVTVRVTHRATSGEQQYEIKATAVTPTS